MGPKLPDPASQIPLAAGVSSRNLGLGFLVDLCSKTKILTLIFCLFPIESIRLDQSPVSKVFFLTFDYVQVLLKHILRIFL